MVLGKDAGQELFIGNGTLIKDYFFIESFPAAGGKIIYADDRDFRKLFSELIDKITADETGAAGNQNGLIWGFIYHQP